MVGEITINVKPLVFPPFEVFKRGGRFKVLDYTFDFFTENSSSGLGSHSTFKFYLHGGNLKSQGFKSVTRDNYLEAIESINRDRMARLKALVG